MFIEIRVQTWLLDSKSKQTQTENLQSKCRNISGYTGCLATAITVHRWTLPTFRQIKRFVCKEMYHDHYGSNQIKTRTRGSTLNFFKRIEATSRGPPDAGYPHIATHSSFGLKRNWPFVVNWSSARLVALIQTDIEANIERGE